CWSALSASKSSRLARTALSNACACVKDFFLYPSIRRTIAGFDDNENYGVWRTIDPKGGARPLASLPLPRRRNAALTSSRLSATRPLATRDKAEGLAAAPGRGGPAGSPNVRFDSGL